MSVQVQDNSTVTIEYAAKLKSGEKILSSEDRGPMTFKIGELSLLRGLNTELLGMVIGDFKKFELKPLNAFGNYTDELLLTAPLDRLPPNLVVGMQLADDERESFWTVVSIDDQQLEATLDGNHSLAGKCLDMEVRLLEIR